MSIRVAINGFGRIGRTLFRLLLDNPGVEVVAINDLYEERILAHLLRFDSSHGPFNGRVEYGPGWMKVNQKKILMVRQPHPEGLPWAKHSIDLVIESTGSFARRSDAKGHLLAGAKKVLVTAYCEDADATLVLGVNHDLYEPEKHSIVSAASCTTNCLAPVVKVLNETFGVEKGLVTTVHSYTNDQRLLDSAHQDLRRARAAALSMIPTTTGAAKAVEKVLPELRGKLDGVSVRVPTADISLADITLLLRNNVEPKDVNEALHKAAHTTLSGILGYSEDPLVSIDYRGCPFSAVVDALQTRVVDGNLVKVSAWYDNEWGYANRLSELTGLLFV